MSKPSPLRRRARDVSLVFCGSLGAYLVSVVIAARLGLALASAVGSWESTWARLALGAVALDLAKAPGLLAAGLLLARASTLTPTVLAAGLAGGVYAFDLSMSLLLHQAGWLWLALPVLLFRLACLMFLLWTLRRAIVALR